MLDKPVTLFLNCIDNQITFNKKNYLMRAAKRLGIDYVQEIVSSHRQNSPENVLNIEPFDFLKGTRWTGMWAIDTLCGNSTFHDHLEKIDTVFIAGTTQQSIGIWFDPYKEILLFQACDLALHRRIPTITQEYDFVTSGSTGGDIYHERDRLFDILASEFTRKDYGKHHPPEEYINYINQAKVQLIRSMNVGGQGEVAQRFFECLAIGPVLTNYVPDLLFLGLKEGYDYLSYSSDAECIEKMKQLLNDDIFRESIARNGRKKAVAFHTYEHRLMTILNIVSQSKEDGTWKRI